MSASSSLWIRVPRPRHDKPVSARPHDPFERQASTACGTPPVQRRRPTTTLVCPRRFTPARTPFACRPGRKLIRALVRASDDYIGRVKPRGFCLAVRRDSSSRPSRFVVALHVQHELSSRRASLCVRFIIYYLLLPNPLTYEMRLSCTSFHI